MESLNAVWAVNQAEVGCAGVPVESGERRAGWG
jgi:hypothetical protein